MSSRRSEVCLLAGRRLRDLPGSVKVIFYKSLQVLIWWTEVFSMIQIPDCCWGQRDLSPLSGESG